MDLRFRRLLALFTCILANGQVWGNAYSYHILYARLSVTFPSQTVHASLIGSLTFGLIFLFSVFVTSLMKRVPLPLIFFSACIVGGLGSVLSAFTTDLRIWYISYVIPMSLSGATMFTMGFCVALMLYPEHSYIVTAMVSSSANFFSIFLPYVWHAGLAHLGLRMTLFMYAGLFAILLPTGFTLPWRYRQVMAEKQRVRLCRRHLIIWVLGLVIASLMFNCPYVHITKLVTQSLDGTTLSPSVITWGMALTLTIGSVLSKALCAYLCHKRLVRGVFLYQIGLLCFAAAQIGFGLASCAISASFLLYCGLCLMMGAGEGPFFSLLLPVTLEVVWPDDDPSTLSFVCAVLAVPLALGGAIGERMYAATGSYLIPFITTGTAFLMAANVMYLIPRQNHFLREHSDDNGVEMQEKDGQMQVLRPEFLSEEKEMLSEN